MAPLRVQVAAFAAMVAVQLNISGSFAGSETGNSLTQGNDGNLGPGAFPSFFGGGSLFDLEKLMGGGFPSLLRGIGGFDGLLRADNSSLSLSLPEGEDTSCQIKIKGGSGGGLSRGLHMGLDTSRRMLHVGMHYEESKKSEEDGKRRSFLSQSVHVSSSIQLPERCIGTAGVVISGLAGYMLDGSETEGLVVLPSSALLGECVEKGELPEDVYRAVTDGDQHAMGLLSEEQRCLAAGFTHIQCNKLGGKKPSVAIVPPAEGPYMPVPRLDVSLDVLN